MENETEIKISIEKIKGEINLIHQKLEMFETNSLFISPSLFLSLNLHHQ